MLHSPKNRTCPSFICWICAITLRQPEGDRKGNSPSMIKASPRASQNVPLSKPYFFAGTAGKLLPRNTLKNSLDAGSTTMTSDFLLKLDL